jgi:hypothetical protein
MRTIEQMPRSRSELASVWPPDADTAAVAGHAATSPMRAIRAKCLDCCCGHQSEVRLCQSTKCALWPFRAGRHPYTSGARRKSALGDEFQEVSGILSRGYPDTARGESE